MIVIVAGMHRSGTSALAGLLHHNGITMGEEENWKPKPNRENPRGFFENKLFRMSNDRMLAEYAYRVKSFSPRIPEISTCSHATWMEMDSLIRRYCVRYTAWGWKDPRTCLTIGIWISAMRAQGLENRLRILIPCRATDDIAKSMVRRGNKGSIAQFEDLTRVYNKRLLEGCNGYKFLTVDFTDLMHKTEATAKRISDYLGMPIEDTSFIETRLADRAA